MEWKIRLLKAFLPIILKLNAIYKYNSEFVDDEIVCSFKYEYYNLHEKHSNFTMWGCMVTVSWISLIAITGAFYIKTLNPQKHPNLPGMPL